MKCDKSYKRNILTTWGMKELKKGRTLRDVQRDISYWMKKTIPEVKEMVMTKTDKIADRIAGIDPLPVRAYRFAEELAKMRGVDTAVVNDFARVSSNPTVYDVDIFVYVDPEFGGTLTNTIKAMASRIQGTMNVSLKGFWTPRSDRNVSEIGIRGLKEFYRRNPYRISIYCAVEE